ncbi:endo-1,4-beta-xylanase [Roseococcus suduntuyensis]|uniref:Beta-xylanase n=1 Tax=Roseococcus suduntuyensis TaxID=455361 RepID=A0A840AIQ3_9PROT|nr:endo-1,4-beta-xylanase [Roseococcus suduntuyensis]MBB3900024.1 endo-1,4-beta-xylanase [Roseococcus suduntuyensis]
MRLPRRLALAAAATPFLPRGSAAQAEGLRAATRARGITFGTAVRHDLLQSDAAYAALVAREAEILVPEWEAKWDALQPEPGRFEFGQLRSIALFARAHQQRLRGHALLWHVANPAWLEPALAQGEARAAAVMEAHFTAVLRETHSYIRDWDVLNEIIANPPGSDNPSPTQDDLRPTPWLRALGPGYLERALRLARGLDATLRLTLNDYGVEADTPWAEAKRQRLLRVVRRLVERQVPLDAVGIQAHLQMRDPFRAEPFLAFVQALRGLGLAVLITELDVREPDQLAPSIAERDAAVADYVTRFLSAAVEGGVRTVLTWGLTDRNTWLAEEPGVARADGQRTRGLPFDEALRPKPFHAALGRVLGG